MASDSFWSDTTCPANADEMATNATNKPTQNLIERSPWQSRSGGKL
jgi:hypothetical protein